MYIYTLPSIVIWSYVQFLVVESDVKKHSIEITNVVDCRETSRDENSQLMAL